MCLRGGGGWGGGGVGRECKLGVEQDRSRRYKRSEKKNKKKK